MLMYASVTSTQICAVSTLWSLTSFFFFLSFCRLLARLERQAGPRATCVAVPLSHPTKITIVDWFFSKILLGDPSNATVTENQKLIQKASV